MAELTVGKNLQDFSSLEAAASEVAIRHYTNDSWSSRRGDGSEAYVAWLFSLFFGVGYQPVIKGNDVDHFGLDLLCTLNDGTTLGVQIKSSRKGVNEFRSKGNLADSIVLLWVDCQSATSRYTIFDELKKFLEANGASLSERLRKLLETRSKLVGMNLPMDKKRGFGKLTENDFQILCRLGLVKIESGCYKFLLTEGEVRN